MDSGNSGSLQSSSGGDEEFDPLSNYFDSFSRSPAAPPPNASSSLLNLDMVWPRGLRSEPTCTEIPTGTLMGSSSSTQPVLKNGTRTPASSSSDRQTFNTNSSSTNPPVRNPKKRSRASRRAPTTVLTTDTSNFRAMVQEFTGIPAPPFSASPPFPRSRFDLFSTPSTTTTMPPYLLRPFPQKFQPPSFPSSASTNSTGTTSGAAISNAAGDMGFTKQTHQSLLNMQNPMFTFQSMLQGSSPPRPRPRPPPAGPSPRYPLPNVPVLGTKSQGSTMVEDFTMSGHHGLPSLQKGSENGSSRGEGMVDSWICSSD